VTTREPKIEVDPGLPVGTHRFQLIVIDRNGAKSAPDVATVQVQTQPSLPTIGITPVQPLPLRPLQTPNQRQRGSTP